MRLHILGIGGTFMAGLALLAKQQGYQVSGSDMNVYPPMSTQLEKQGIKLIEGYAAETIDNSVDCVIVGNVIKRGNPAIEYVLNQRLPYLSGPAWLAQSILKKRRVLAIAGTHGKTTTSSMLAFILHEAGHQAGFLIGGIPENFGYSATLGKDPYFVIEADEYDSAFFDKRSKFIHYQPEVLILNNLEYDHADIFPNLAAIQQQFHYLIRTIPSSGRIIHPTDDDNVTEALQLGCWTPIITFGNTNAAWQARLLKTDGSQFQVIYQEEMVGTVDWSLLGQHNVNNALAAIAAANEIHIAPAKAIAALSKFKSVKRRLEIKGIVKDITIYDDFAHHPTAIRSTLSGLRARIGRSRLITILEFGSYTMRQGVHKAQIQTALQDADMVICKAPIQEWGLQRVLETFIQPTAIYQDVNTLVEKVAPMLRAGDHVVVMSNSGFDGIHYKLLTALDA